MGRVSQSLRRDCLVKSNTLETQHTIHGGLLGVGIEWGMGGRGWEQSFDVTHTTGNLTTHTWLPNNRITKYTWVTRRSSGYRHVTSFKPTEDSVSIFCFHASIIQLRSYQQCLLIIKDVFHLLYFSVYAQVNVWPRLFHLLFISASICSVHSSYCSPACFLWSIPE